MITLPPKFDMSSLPISTIIVDFGRSVGSVLIERELCSILIEDLPSRNFSKPLMSSTLFNFTTEGLMSLVFGLVSGSSSKISPNSSLTGLDKVVDIDVVGKAGGLSMSNMDFRGLFEDTGVSGPGGGGGGAGFGGSLGGRGGAFCWCDL